MGYTVSKVPQGHQYLKAHKPEGLELLIDIFDTPYVSDSYHRIYWPVGPESALHSTIISSQAVEYSWVTPYSRSRTNNMHESWADSFRSLVGRAHPSLSKTTDSLGKDKHSLQVDILHDSCGQPLRKRVHYSTAQLQQKLHNLYTSVHDCPNLWRHPEGPRGFLKWCKHANKNVSWWCYLLLWQWISP